MIQQKRKRMFFACVLVALALFSSSTFAFTNLHQTTTTQGRAQTKYVSSATTLPRVTHVANHDSRPRVTHFANHDSHRRGVLYFSEQDNNSNDLQGDWKALTKAAGTFGRNLGGKVVSVIWEVFGNLKERFSQGMDRVRIVVRQEEEGEVNEPTSNVAVAVNDEDLFRSLLGDEGLFVIPSEPTKNSIDAVVTQAASILAKDELTTKLLGPSLRYGRPFSQSSWTTSINGRSTTTVRASFEVWGSQGEGVASVAVTDGALTSLDIQVHGRHYRLSTTTTAPSNQAAEAYNENHDSIKVEIMDGIRRPSAKGSDNVLDAEILDN